jgi:hypothetical protein
MTTTPRAGKPAIASIAALIAKSHNDKGHEWHFES